MELVFGEYKININDYVLNVLKGYKQIEDKKESGGILFGKKSLDSNHYFLVDLTVPNSDDLCSKFSFLRRAKNAQKIINEKWEGSGGYVNYIGEWHTHPEASPTPSRTDIKTYKKISKDKSSLFEISVNIIFGNCNLLYICAYKNGKIASKKVFSLKEKR